MDYRKLIKEEIAKLHTAKEVKVNPKLDSDLGEQIVADICRKVVKNYSIPLVSESKLWYVEFKQKGSTHVMSTTSDTSSRDAIERDLLLRDYEMVNIRRIYFR